MSRIIKFQFKNKKNFSNFFQRQSMLVSNSKYINKCFSTSRKASNISTIKNKNQEYRVNTGLFINGDFLEGYEEKKINIYDPSTENLICSVSEGSDKDLDYAVKCAKNAFEIWTNVSLDERSKLFMKLAGKLDENIEEFSWLEGLDNGKSLSDAREDMKEVVRLIRYFSGLSENIYGKTYLNTSDMSIHTRRIPYGVVGCITPWNYPLLMTAWKIFPPLAAGNAVVLKQSEVTPITGLKLAMLFQEVGFPRGFLNVLTGYGQTLGAYLSSHNCVDKIAFTGSTNTGRSVMKSAADSNLKSVSLELGGKSPMVVFKDANLKSAIEWILDGAFRNSSQNCAAGSRLYIEDDIYDELIELLVHRTKQIKIGRFDEDDVWMGPLVNDKQYKNCLNYLQIAEEEGLQCALKGGRMTNYSKGFFISPSIFKNVPENSRLAKEEIFGPILTVLKPFKNINEVIEKCNDTFYGLAAACFTTDMNKSEYFVRNIKSGTVWVNNYNLCPYNIPFGGMKQSGFGRDCGDEALMEYTQLKSVYQKYDFSKLEK
jgi:aldehyde dehydrogenase (NAD+)